MDCAGLLETGCVVRDAQGAPLAVAPKSWCVRLFVLEVVRPCRCEDAPRAAGL